MMVERSRGCGSRSRHERLDDSLCKAEPKLAGRWFVSCGGAASEPRERLIFSRSCWISVAAEAVSSPPSHAVPASSRAAACPKTAPTCWPITPTALHRCRHGSPCVSKQGALPFAVLQSRSPPSTAGPLVRRHWITRARESCRYGATTYSRVSTSVPIHLSRTRR